MPTPPRAHGSFTGRFCNMFSKHVPEGKVAWLKVDRRPGALNVYEKNIVFTDPMEGIL